MKFVELVLNDVFDHILHLLNPIEIYSIVHSSKLCAEYIQKQKISTSDVSIYMCSILELYKSHTSYLEPTILQWCINNNWVINNNIAVKLLKNSYIKLIELFQTVEYNQNIINLNICNHCDELDTLKWLYSNNYNLKHKNILLRFCITKDLEIVKYLINVVKVPIPMYILDDVIVHSDYAIFEYIYSVFDATMDHVDLLNVYEHLLYYSVVVNKTDMFLFLITKNFILDQELLIAAIENKNVEILNILLEHNCPYDNDIWCDIIADGDLDILHLFINHGYVLTSCDSITVYNCINYKCVEYILNNTNWAVVYENNGYTISNN